MLTKSQQNAKKLFLAWWKSKIKKTKNPFLIGGGAGTGKTFLINHLLEEIKLPSYKVLVVSYTGQAVSVLRRRGVNAFTIYSKFMELEMVKKKDENGNIVHRGGIPLLVPRWKPVESLDGNYDLIIVEEASFVNVELAKLINSFKVPVLYVGDHIQLPPVVGEQYFTENKLTCVLEDVMRQAEDSVLLKYLTNLRRGNRINISDYKEDVYFLKSDSIETAFKNFPEIFKNTDMIISATNKNRGIVTNLYRKNILHADNTLPVRGEKMICRRNRWNYKIQDYPLVNGTIGYSLGSIPLYDVDRSKDIFYMDFQPTYIKHDYFDRMICQLSFLEAPFGDKEITHYMVHNLIEYGSCITAHLSQGDQYDNIMYIPSWNGDVDYKRRLDYTAVSRAKKEAFILLI